MILKNSTTGTTILEADHKRTDDNEIVLKNYSSGTGLDAGSLGGVPSSDILRNDQDETIDVLHQTGKPTFWGSLDTKTSGGTDYNPVLTTVSNVGFTVTGSTCRLTITKAGKYYARAQQLISTTGGIYFRLRKNGVTTAHGYANNNTLFNVQAACIFDCAIGDYIEVFVGGTTSYAWGGTGHSTFHCFLIN